MMRLVSLDCDEVVEWPRYAQLLVIILLILVIQLIGYWCYLSPKRQMLAELKQQEYALKSSISMKASKAASLRPLQVYLTELTEHYHSLLHQLPLQQELASLLVSVNELGLQHSLTFTRMEWGEVLTEEFLYRLPLNIELIGYYHNIGDFSAAIAQLPRMINFDEVDWQRVSQESNRLHLRVRAYTYQLKMEANHE